MQQPHTLKERILQHKLLLFVLLSFLLYGNTLRNGYGIDDQFVTENNITNQGLKSIKKIFNSYYAEDGKNTYEYRPVVKASFAIEHQLFGVRPWVGHLINILLYGCCLFLLYRALLLVLHGQPPLFSLYATIAFAFLPVHAEVVASLKNRDVLICFICCMGALIQTDAFFRTGSYIHLLYAALLSMTGFLTKYDLLPYLAITPLVLYKKYRAQGRWLPLLYGTAVFVSGLYISKGVKYLLLHKTGAERLYNYTENPLFFDHSFHLKLSAAFNSLGFYAKMLVFPSNMVCYYGYNTLPVDRFLTGYAVAGMILFALMVFFFFRLIKTDHPMWYAIVFSGLSISMYLNLVKPVTGIVAERFLFFASIGFSIAVTYLLLRFLNGGTARAAHELKPSLKAVSIVLLAACLYMTTTRNAEWKNRITLYEHDVKKRPESAPLHMLYSMEILSNLDRPSYFLTDQNRMQYIDRASKSLKTLLTIDSLNVSALHNLGYIHQHVYNDFNGAIPYYEKALRSEPSKFESRFNLAYCYYHAGRGAQAERLCLDLLPGHGDYQPLLDLLNYILIGNRKSHEGIALFESLSKKYPDNSSIPIILGNFHLALADTVGAKSAYEQALKKDPSNDQLIKIVDKLSEKQVQSIK